MSARLRSSAALLALTLLAAPRALHAQAADSSVVYDSHGLEALVPDAARAPFAVHTGIRQFQERLEVSPGYGVMGTDKLFVLRAAYHPSRWLGYEAMLGHNPGKSVHAVLHTFGVLARWPLHGRFQPYATAGYGMVMVNPGPSLNAKPVTKNALSGGAGLELFIREDLALRGEWRQAAVFGEQRGRDGVVVYDYTQATIGLAFYRSIRP
ncbi:MAG: outer membrane beta-barrel protein [Candidatus Eisenbacteria bacterium]